MDLTPQQVAAYDALFNRGLKRVRPYVLIDGVHRSAFPAFIARALLRKGITDFQAALAIAPDGWECAFWIGKALQRIGEHPQAMTWFSQALAQAPENVTVAKEAANAALYLGQYQIGIAYLRPAIALSPTDPVLYYNLAIHLLLAGRAQEAFESATSAARLEAHPFTGRLLTVIEDVLAKRRPCPTSLDQVLRGA